MKKSNKKVPDHAPKVPEAKYKLLGNIAYNTMSDIENLEKGLTTETALFVLISAVNFAQSKGAYNLTEASLISNAIKKFMKPQVEAEQKPAEKA